MQFRAVSFRFVPNRLPGHRNECGVHIILKQIVTNQEDTMAMRNHAATGVTGRDLEESKLKSILFF